VPNAEVTFAERTEGRRQEALLTADALQRAIFNSANFSSIATDAQGVIQIFNVGAERMLGYAAAEVMNQITPADISDPQELIARSTALTAEFATMIAPGFEALVFKASRGIEDIYELTYIRKDGSRFPAVVSVTALRDAQETIIGYLLIGTDNTARKRVEAEQEKLDERLRDQQSRLDQALQEKNRELQIAKVAAENANRSKSDFLSSMSHELRSPLNGILGFAQLLESDMPPPTASQKESIGQILHSGWHLLNLINEILDLAKIEAGRLSLSPESVSLAEVMNECQGMIGGLAQKRGIQIAFPTFDLPRFVHADRTRLKQVVINLLSNAIKYSHALGKVEVRCTASTPGFIRISIEDKGEGLSAARLAQLFQPFNRLGQEASGVEGSGIGLVVAKQLIELMEGEIGVESAVGVGSTFWFELIAAAEPGFATGSGEPDAPVPSEVRGDGPGRLVLYVEDNLANLRLVERLIERRPGLRLISAVTGELGIALARARRPDVILMDINLPDMTGIEALEVVRRDPATAHIPVVAISANAMAFDVEKGRKAGFFEYLTKPIKINEFTVTLTAALELAEKNVGGERRAGTTR
jgi:signal transduction histidine kinase/ActR/RegA family two-component response regulator